LLALATKFTGPVSRAPEKCRAPIVPSYEGINRLGQVHEELTEDRVLAANRYTQGDIRNDFSYRLLMTVIGFTL
jgi:hypothetical protein